MNNEKKSGTRWLTERLDSVLILAAITAFLHFVGIASEESFLIDHQLPSDIFLPDTRVLLYRGFRFVIGILYYFHGVPALGIFVLLWALFKATNSWKLVRNYWFVGIPLIGIALFFTLRAAQRSGEVYSKTGKYGWARIEFKKDKHPPVLGRVAAFNKDAIAIIDEKGTSTVILAADVLSIQTQAERFVDPVPNVTR